MLSTTFGAAEPVAEPPAPKARPDSVWAVPELKELLEKLGARVESSKNSVCFVAPLGKDATTTALELGLDPARTVAVDPLFGFAKRRTLMTTPVTRPEVRDAALGLQKILAVLEAMHSFYLEPRYRPSPWLRRRARLGVSLLTPE